MGPEVHDLSRYAHPQAHPVAVHLNRAGRYALQLADRHVGFVLLCLMKTARFMDIGLRWKARRIGERQLRGELVQEQMRSKLFLFQYRICNYLQIKTQQSQ